MSTVAAVVLQARGELLVSHSFSEIFSNQSCILFTLISIFLYEKGLVSFDSSCRRVNKIWMKKTQSIFMLHSKLSNNDCSKQCKYFKLLILIASNIKVIDQIPQSRSDISIFTWIFLLNYLVFVWVSNRDWQALKQPLWSTEVFLDCYLACCIQYTPVWCSCLRKIKSRTNILRMIET